MSELTGGGAHHIRVPIKTLNRLFYLGSQIPPPYIYIFKPMSTDNKEITRMRKRLKHFLFKTSIAFLRSITNRSLAEFCLNVMKTRNPGTIKYVLSSTRLADFD